MKYIIEYADGVSHQISHFKRSNPQAFAKLKALLLELQDHPRTGTGHPEPLRGYNGITWSRRITKKDRLVYNIYDDVVMVMVVSVEGHYDDK